LTPEVKLTGHFKDNTKRADLRGIMREINDARDDAIRRRYERED
jgi:RIO kinase 1